MITKEREELIAKFQQWFNTNPNKSIMAYECANIAEKYYESEVNKLIKPAVSGQLVDFLTWYIHKSEFSKDTYNIKLIVDEYLKSTNLH